MKQICILLSFFIFSLIAAKSQPYTPNKLYSTAELQTDFSVLRDSIEKIHPNLYMYTPKAEFDAFFDSLYQSITTPLTDMQFYNKVTLLNGKIKNGHTMFLPGDSATAYFTKNCKFLPFYVRIINNRLYVNMNCSGNVSMQEGSEILSINGTKTTDILNYLFARKIRDGYNTTYPAWILNNYFKEYYSFTFGHPETFTITYKQVGKQVQTTLINGLSKDSIRHIRAVKYANRITINQDGKGITLALNKPHAYAVLTIKTFSSDDMQSIYNQNFKTAIDSAFTVIQTNNIKQLILDVRDNQGGDFENGQLLLSYLLGKPFQLLVKGQATEMVQPLTNRFAGKLYVLINGGSFSNTAIVCSRLVYYKRGTFIGEETGGNNTIISGFADDETNLQLPNTKINCAISNTSFLIRDDIKNTGHGTLPDYYVTPTVDDVIHNVDVVKNFAVGLVLRDKIITAH